MRADRLVAALLLLQARGRLTAAQLAGELEVSLATARRDLEALSASGVPVYPQTGRGGGWQLIGGARTDLTGLTADEARALFLLAGPPAAHDPAARSALRKLVGALPAPFRGDAEAAAGAVVVDAAGWGERDSERPANLEVLQRAVVARRQVDLTYAGRSGPPSVRRVHPWALVDKDGTWYLLAGVDGGASGEGHARRTYRLDRIRAVTVLDDAAQRPDDVDVAREWQQVVDEMERRRSLVSATVLLDARLWPVLRDRFGRHAELLEDAERGVGSTVRARVAAHLPIGVAQELAGFGSAVEVEGPAEVRAELARLGAELVARYG